MLPRGSRVGVYEIVSVLGQGSFGITYRARAVADDRDVAIKEYFPASLALREPDSTVLPRSTDVAEEFIWGRERFVEEERTLARLRGAPAVVSVLDFIEAYGTAYMVMALVEGETLDVRLKRVGRLPQADIDRLLEPLLDGLTEVHAAGFLHRDIKPGNIIVDSEGRPTLIDFGAARAAMVGRTQTLTAVFTPGYAPIEQFTSGKQGPFTDIYALGATLYQCVEGVVPPSAIDRMVGTDMVPASVSGRGSYSSHLLVGIDAALIPGAADRPQSIAAWREIFASGVGPDLAATRIIPRPASQRSRRRGIWIGISAAAAILVVSVGGYFALSPSGPTATEIALRQNAEQQSADRRAEQASQQAALEARAKGAEEARRVAEESQAKSERARLKAEEESARLAQAEKARQDAVLKEKEDAQQKADQAARQRAAEEAQRLAEANDKKAAEAVETALRLAVVDRQHLQVALTSLGFNTAGTDGVFGTRSRDMIAGWQTARSQPPTGFFTGAQQKALLQEATAAIATFDESQKKLDEEKKKAEDDRKRADDARRAIEAQQKVEEEAKAHAAPALVGPSGASDGTYFAKFQANGGDRVVTISVSSGRGTGTVSNLTCGSGPISVAITPDGTISGGGKVYSKECVLVALNISGRVTGGRLEINLATSVGTNHATLLRQNL